MIIGLYSMPILITSSHWPTCPTTKMSSCVFCAFMLGQVTCNTMRPCWRRSKLISPKMLDCKQSLKTSMTWNALPWLIEIIFHHCDMLIHLCTYQYILVCTCMYWYDSDTYSSRYVQVFWTWTVGIWYLQVGICSIWLGISEEIPSYTYPVNVRYILIVTYTFR